MMIFMPQIPVVLSPMAPQSKLVTAEVSTFDLSSPLTL